MASMTDVNSKLYAACEAGDLTKVKQCLSGGGDVNSKTWPYDMTCVMAACYWNRAEVVNYLLDNCELKINVTTSYGSTALICAVVKNSAECVSLLLQNQNIDLDVNVTNSAGDTALTMACSWNSTECVSLLLQNQNIDLDVNVTNSDGDTALIMACSRISTECVRLLANYNNVDFDVRDKCNQTAEETARSKGYIDIVKIIEVARINKKLLHAFTTGDLTAIQLALLGGGDVNVCLMWACGTNGIDCVKTLLKQENVDLKVRNEDNKTVVEIARSKGYTDIVQIIEGWNNKKLLNACIVGDVTAVKQALFAQADINFKDDDGWTSLMHACDTNSIECARILLDQEDINLDVRNRDNQNGEEIARSKSFMDIVQIIQIEKSILSGNLGNLQRFSKLLKQSKATEEQAIINNKRENDKIVTSLREDNEKRETILREQNKNKEMQVKKTNEEKECEFENKYKEEARHLKEKYEQESTLLNQTNEKELTKLKIENEQEANKFHTKNEEEESKIKKQHDDMLSQQDQNLIQIQNDLERMRIRGEEIVGLFSPSRPTTTPECPICMELMSPPLHVFQCSNGHHICSNCKHRMEKCGFCGSNYIGRAIDMEKYIREQE